MKIFQIVHSPGIHQHHHHVRVTHWIGLAWTISLFHLHYYSVTIKHDLPSDWRNIIMRARPFSKRKSRNASALEPTARYIFFEYFLVASTCAHSTSPAAGWNCWNYCKRVFLLWGWKILTKRTNVILIVFVHVNRMWLVEHIRMFYALKLNPYQQVWSSPFWVFAAHTQSASTREQQTHFTHVAREYGLLFGAEPEVNKFIYVHLTRTI